MLSNDTRVLCEAMQRQLQRELSLQRKLLALAERKRDATVANDLPALEEVIRAEQSLTDELTEYRRIREDLLRRLSVVRGMRGEQRPTLRSLLNGLADPLCDKILALGDELRSILHQLVRVNETNQVIMRTALGMVRQVMSAFTGDTGREGYDRSGNGGEQRGSGGLMNFQA
ncbi:MAG: flagellar protein FlgN [Planctomycetota bacterium]|nr:MAG: flagellar protein FlgN [Planctomycetota bacterium]